MVVAILAGGLGTRLTSAIGERPKCLAEINGRPFIDYLLTRIKRSGFGDILMFTGYRGEQVEAHLGDGSGLGLRIHYSREDAPRGTAGALKQATSRLKDPFLLLNGDTVSDVNLKSLQAAFIKNEGAIASIALCTVNDTAAFGSVVVDANDNVIAFEEKAEARGPGWVNAGAYCMSPAILDFIPDGASSSIETDLLPSLLAAHNTIVACRTPGTFFDIGNPTQLERAAMNPFFAGL